MARIVQWFCAVSVLVSYLCLPVIECKRFGSGGRRSWGLGSSKPKPTFSHTSSNAHGLSYSPHESSGVHSRKPSAPPAPPHDGTVHRDIGWNVGNTNTNQRNIGWNTGNTPPRTNAGAPPPYPAPGTNAGAPPPYPGHPSHGSNVGAPPPYPGHPSHGSNVGPPPPYPGYPSHGSNVGPPPPYPGYPGQSTHMGAPPPYHGQTHYNPSGHYPGYGGYQPQPTYGGFPVGYPGGHGGFPGGFGGYGTPGYGGYGSPGFGGLGGLGGIASGYGGYKKSSGISAGTAISGALLGLTLWNLARDHNHYHVYYPYAYNQQNSMSGNTVTTSNLSPDMGSFSSFIGNMTCITSYNARAVRQWANNTLQDFHNAYPKTPFPGSENSTTGYNFTVMPGEIIHREPMVMTCCATAGPPVKLKYLSSGKLSDVNCLQQSYIMPFRKLKFIPINATATNTTNNNQTATNSTQPPNTNATSTANVTAAASVNNATEVNVTTVPTPAPGNATVNSADSSNQNTSAATTPGTSINVEVTTINT